MAIVYPLDLPPSGVKTVRFRPFAIVGMTRSEFTGEQQVIEHQGQLWAADVTVRLMRRADAEEWISWRLKLNGRRGTFRLGDKAGAAPRGLATGTPLVMGAGQTGTALATDGWTPSQAGILKTGDYVQLGDDLYKQLEDVSSDGSGQATLTLWPAIRTAYADNTPITVSNTTGLFRMEENVMPWDVNESLIYGGIAFGCVQAR